MQKIHKDCIPQPEEWTISGADDISASAVKWFQLIAGTVKLLSVHIEEFDTEPDTSFLPQLLAAASAPALRKLEIGNLLTCTFLEPAMHSLALLSQLQELHLSDWDLTGARQLSGLHSLQACPPQ